MNLDAYTNLTDHVFHQILLSKSPYLKDVSILVVYYVATKPALYLYVVAGAAKQNSEKGIIQVHWPSKTKE